MAPSKFSDFRVLPNLAAVVKIMLCVSMGISNIYPTENSPKVLEVGEISIIRAASISHFSIGDKSVLKAKAKKGEVYVRALTQGKSDIILWFRGEKSPQTFSFLVLNKKSNQSLVSLKRELQKIGLMAKLEHRFLKVSGIIEKRSHYSTFIRLYQVKPEAFHLDKLTVTPLLQKAIYSDFLYKGLIHYQDDLDCKPTQLFIRCYDISKESGFKKKMNNLFLVSWISSKNKEKTQQFKIKLRLFQFENLKGNHFSLGLYGAGGILKNILKGNPLALIENNNVALNKSDYQFSTLAEPTIVGRLNYPIKIRLGSEIPYVNTNRDGQTSTQWRFAGLNIDLTIKKVLNNYRIDYKSGLSRPSTEESIQSNQQSSSIQLARNKKAMLFEIGFLVTDQKKQRLPVIEHIPLINHLFSTYDFEKVFKKVIGIIEIQEIYATSDN